MRLARRQVRRLLADHSQDLGGTARQLRPRKGGSRPASDVAHAKARHRGATASFRRTLSRCTGRRVAWYAAAANRVSSRAGPRPNMRHFAQARKLLSAGKMRRTLWLFGVLGFALYACEHDSENAEGSGGNGAA